MTKSPLVRFHLSVCGIALCLFAESSAYADDWKAADGPLMTRWAKEVSPAKVWREYPRPQMVRKDWTNLNGLWDYAIAEKDAPTPSSWDGEILVPFCIESALSGVMKPIGTHQALWYRRTFALPKRTDGQRLLLHFGAVDWHATVWVNGKQVGEHRGGYDPFSFDITDALKNEGEQILLVKVLDPVDAGYQPRGKQVRKPRGIWYTSVTGIWQTVWLEPVSSTHVNSLRITPDIDRGTVTASLRIKSEGGAVKIAARIEDGGRPVGKESSTTLDGIKPEDGPIALTLDLRDARLWSPDSPHLYDLIVTVTHGDRVTDRVQSYFGMRKIELKKDKAGFNRLFLNNKPLFQYGPLDQGWWPDGLYTAPTDEALKYDIEVTRKLGFNMCRKHVKVEPARWYYWCDKLGLLVWQDMPSGDKYIGRNAPDYERSAQSEAGFRREWEAVINFLRNHPSVVVWVPFNEGWGQFKTNEILDWTKKLDPTRLVDGPSGWADRRGGDLHDMHMYPGPGMVPPEEHRASVLGEFGGLGLPVKDHTWQNEKNWGYRSFKTADALTSAYVNLLQRLHPLIGKGLAAAVYTQTTDVEIEVNGLMTYDRAVVKMDAKTISAAAQRLFEPPPVVKIVVPTSQLKAQPWRHTTTPPPKGWMSRKFDDSKWTLSSGGFGTRETPGAVARTEWSGSDIWIRRPFDLQPPFDGLQLLIHHDEDAEIYLNGVLAATLSGYTSEYTIVPIEKTALTALTAGQNTIAIHCHQTRGGQYIDAGLVILEEPNK